MPRRVTLPCASCGELMWVGPGTLPEGQAMHQACRTRVLMDGPHKPRYQKGCRCEPCRLAQNERMRERYHRIKTYDPTRSCIICSTEFVADRHTTRTCSESCRHERKRRNHAARRARVRGLFVETVVPRQIFERDGWRCHICRRKLRPTTKHPHPHSATLDHLIPLSRGGLHEPANVATACYACNTAKGNRGGNEQLLLIG